LTGSHLALYSPNHIDEIETKTNCGTKKQIYLISSICNC